MTEYDHATSATPWHVGLYATISGLLLLVAIVGNVTVGDLSIPPKTAFFAITNKFGLTAITLNPIHESIIWEYRLSRSLVAACCGAGLALCGAVLQSILRNDLAEPYVLGISAGASTGAVCIVVLGLGAGTLSLSGGAFLGSIAAFCLVAILSDGARANTSKTILAGVAASQLFSALTAYIVSTTADAQQAHDIMFWLLGSLGGARWPEFRLLAIILGLTLLACLCSARLLDAFFFGDETAASMGVPVNAVRIALFIVVGLMTSTIVSIVGAIGFVGLVVPHAARFLMGPMHARLLPACALLGAIFMVIADIVSRTILPQQILPIGVVTALIGVPVFCWMLYRVRE